MRNRAKIIVGLVVGVLLGATVFAGAVANADHSRPLHVEEQNVDSDGNIKVHEQGTVAVQEVRVPFQFNGRFDDWAGGTSRTARIDVPGGKTLIAQTITYTVSVEPGQRARANVTFQGAFSTVPAMLAVPMQFQGRFNGKDVYTGTEAITAYAAGQGGVTATTIRSSASGDGGPVELSFTGYLVDAP